MLKIIKRLIFIVLIYFLSWTVSYSVFMGFDFRYYIEYLYLAWTNPGEKPVFIQMIAIVLTIITTSIYFFAKRKKLSS
jgi:heme A synthase